MSVLPLVVVQPAHAVLEARVNARANVVLEARVDAKARVIALEGVAPGAMSDTLRLATVAVMANAGAVGSSSRYRRTYHP